MRSTIATRLIVGAEVVHNKPVFRVVRNIAPACLIWDSRETNVGIVRIDNKDVPVYQGSSRFWYTL